MTTTDDSKSAVADKLSLSEKVVRKAKEAVIFIHSVEELVEYYTKEKFYWRCKLCKQKFMGRNHMAMNSHIRKHPEVHLTKDKPLVEEINRQAEEIERLNKKLEDYAIQLERKDKGLSGTKRKYEKSLKRIADLEKELEDKKKENQELNKLIDDMLRKQGLPIPEEFLQNSLRKSGEKK